MADRFWNEISRAAWKENSEFPKTFKGGYLFAFVEYFSNLSAKMRKKFKNYVLVLAIVNHQNWLDDLRPLIVTISFQVFKHSCDSDTDKCPNRGVKIETENGDSVIVYSYNRITYNDKPITPPVTLSRSLSLKIKGVYTIVEFGSSKFERPTSIFVYDIIIADCFKVVTI